METVSGFTPRHAVPRGRTPKLHRPWKGPYVVVKALSDVTYRIQLEAPGGRRRRQRLVVHFNRLKPCQSPPEGTARGPATRTPPAQDQPTPALRNQEQDTRESPGAIISWPPEDSPELCDTVETTQSREPETTRGGRAWEGRLRRIVRPPEHFQSSFT